MPQRTNYRGVAQHTSVSHHGKWRVAIDVSKRNKSKSLWLGQYDDPKIAAKVRDVALWHLWKLGWKQWSRMKWNFPPVSKDEPPLTPPSISLALLLKHIEDNLPKCKPPHRRK